MGPYPCGVSRLLASFFGSGLLLRRITGGDLGSGTVGSALALAISIVLIQTVGVWAQAAALMVTTAVSLVAVAPFAADEGDPGWVVVDEAAGTFLATLGLTAIPALVAFSTFRVADVFKRVFPGVDWAERSLPGAVGVTADDLVAGLYGLAAGWAIQLLV